MDYGYFFIIIFFLNIYKPIKAILGLSRQYSHIPFIFSY
jgi:hypothetical protein